VRDRYPEDEYRCPLYPRKRTSESELAPISFDVVPILLGLPLDRWSAFFRAADKKIFASSPDSRLFLAIPYRAGELRQHAIEYETRVPPGIFVRHFSIHAQKRIAIFFE